MEMLNNDPLGDLGDLYDKSKELADKVDLDKVKDLDKK